MKSNIRNSIKFMVCSLIGVTLFFIPVYNSKVPIVFLIEGTKKLMGQYVEWVAPVAVGCLFIFFICYKVFKVKVFERVFRGDGKVKYTFFIISMILVSLLVSDADISIIQNPEIGGRVLSLGSTVFVTIAMAGILVSFILYSGIVEFIAVIFEPVVRPVFKLPGEAAVNIIASFVSSASIGVYITEQYYVNGVYTTRQACSVVANFSVISVGYIGVLASLTGLDYMYGKLLIFSFLLVLIMGTIIIRIPPFTGLSDKYYDGNNEIIIKEKMPAKVRIKAAVDAGIEKSSEFTPMVFKNNMINAFIFSMKIISVMMPTIMLVFTIAYYTPLFDWLGYPLIPVLQLLGIPEAQYVSQSVLVGIVEVSLPSILISGHDVPAMSSFFVVLLSIVQVIFFSEAGNAILSSKIPLNAGKLILIFLIRTAIAIPLVALVSHLLF